MNVLELASEALRAAGCVCASDDGGLSFSGPLGQGWITEEPQGCVRLRYDLSAAADDPVALARISARTAGSVRITLRRRTAFAEQTCSAAQVAASLHEIGQMRALQTGPDLPVEDLSVGMFDAPLAVLGIPTFLRLALVSTDASDWARATYLLLANTCLRAGKGGWVEGPGLAVDPADADRDLLRAELYEIGHALAVLGDERIARSYLELCGVKSMTQPGVAAPATRDATTKGGL